jgi:hypothetical protein
MGVNVHTDIEHIEYFGGPACGRTERAILAGDGKPSALRIVQIPARYRSALDDEPTVPEEVHRYRRLGEEPDGEVWRYTWSGALH